MVVWHLLVNVGKVKVSPTQLGNTEVLECSCESVTGAEFFGHHTKSFTRLSCKGQDWKLLQGFLFVVDLT